MYTVRHLVEVCNFDAIVMTHEHEMSTYSRNGDRVDLPTLLEIGHKFQKATDWIPPTKRVKKGQEPDTVPAASRLSLRRHTKERMMGVRRIASQGVYARGGPAICWLVGRR
ncbi:MAG: hypothetical protein CM1200mP27_04510 [Chloroflexota bacterium]|nr:MAG: hypothetical protein CM1200mP27_04510 [Chloroflexota bacterium]